MKTMKKKFTSALLALTLIIGAVSYPTNEAKAAVVINFTVPGIGAALAGLGVFMFAVTFGIAADIHPGILGAMCLLDKEVDQNTLDKVKVQLARDYGLQDNLIGVIQDYMKSNTESNQVISNADGSKSIVLLPNQLEDVMSKASNAGLSEESASKLNVLLSYVPTQDELNAMRAEIAATAN